MADMLPEAAVQGAFDWLLKSSEDIAKARGNCIRAEYKAKRVHARLFKRSDGNVEMRKACATDHDEYAQAMENVAIAETTWELMKDQRNRAELIIEAWRSQEASNRGLSRMR